MMTFAICPVSCAIINRMLSARPLKKPDNEHCAKLNAPPNNRIFRYSASRTRSSSAWPTTLKNQSVPSPRNAVMTPQNNARYRPCQLTEPILLSCPAPTWFAVIVPV